MEQFFPPNFLPAVFNCSMFLGIKACLPDTVLPDLSVIISKTKYPAHFLGGVTSVCGWWVPFNIDNIMLPSLCVISIALCNHHWEKASLTCARDPPLSTSIAVSLIHPGYCPMWRILQSFWITFAPANTTLARICHSKISKYIKAIWLNCAHTGSHCIICYKTGFTSRRTMLRKPINAANLCMNNGGLHHRLTVDSTSECCCEYK